MRPGPRLVVMVALAFISGAQSSTNQQQRESSNRGKLLSKRDESAKYETSQQTSTSFLSNINPWLSACDLAQPNTAPDLQVINQSICFNITTFLFLHLFNVNQTSAITQSDKEIFELIVNQIKTIDGTKKKLINTCLACDSIPYSLFVSLTQKFSIFLSPFHSLKCYSTTPPH